MLRIRKIQPPQGNSLRRFAYIYTMLFYACGSLERVNLVGVLPRQVYIGSADMAADDSLTEDCNKLISAYSVYYPQKAEAFMYDVVDGQSYTVNCGGMRATTTVRTQK